MEKTHYKVKEAAPVLGISDYSVREWCRLGVINAIKIRKNWLIPQSEIDRLLNSVE